MESRISLLQAVAFWFEKNEVVAGWSQRIVPMETEDEARETFANWVQELSRWKGTTATEVRESGQRAQWSDIRIKQQGRGVGLWIRYGQITEIWAEVEQDWDDDACAHVYRWEWDSTTSAD